MTFSNLALVLLCVVGISIGQILFKLASATMPSSLGVDGAVSLLTNKYLLTALVIYGLATIGWVYSLRVVPLTVAYPFMALAFVIVPLLSAMFLRETIPLSLILGTALIVSGIVVIIKK